MAVSAVSQWEQPNGCQTATTVPSVVAIGQLPRDNRLASGHLYGLTLNSSVEDHINAGQRGLREASQRSAAEHTRGLRSRRGRLKRARPRSPLRIALGAAGAACAAMAFFTARSLFTSAQLCTLKHRVRAIDPGCPPKERLSVAFNS